MITTFLTENRDFFAFLCKFSIENTLCFLNYMLWNWNSSILAFLRFFVKRNYDVITSRNLHNRVQSAKFSQFDIPEAVLSSKTWIYDFFVNCYDDVIVTGKCQNHDQWPIFSQVPKFHHFWQKFKTRMVSLKISLNKIIS